LLWRLSVLLGMASIAFCTLASLLAPFLIPLVFGHQFRDAVPIFEILVWQLLWLPLIWLRGWIVAIGEARVLARHGVLDMITMTVLLALLVPSLGIWGAATGVVLRTFIWAAGASLIAQYYWKLHMRD
jgi:O-antigen/teichoic acid export membrane protein